MSITEYGAEQWSGAMFGLVSLPASFYVALVTDEPGEGWDGSVLSSIEPVDVAYARQPLAVPTDFVVSDGGFVINAVDLTFPDASEDWDVVRLFALTDALVDGNLWSFGWLSDEILVLEGLPAQLPVGSIYHGLGNQQSTIAE